MGSNETKVNKKKLKEMRHNGEGEKNAIEIELKMQVIINITWQKNGSVRESFVHELQIGKHCWCSNMRSTCE